MSKINLISTVFEMIANQPVFLNTTKQPIEVYFFYGRSNDVLCINKENKKIEYQIDDLDQINISITSPTDFTIQSKNGEPLFLKFGSHKEKAEQPAAPPTPTQNLRMPEKEELEKPVMTVDAKEYPSIAMCQECKNGKRCSTHDALNGQKYGDKGRALKSPEDLEECENYCFNKIQQFNCHL